jgi:hypothetical protein
MPSNREFAAGAGFLSNELVRLGLHDDLAEHEVGRGVDGLEDERGGCGGGDHFVALDGHLDVVPERGIDPTEVE